MRRKIILITIGAIVGIVLLAAGVAALLRPESIPTRNPAFASDTSTPSVSDQVLVEGRRNVWDIGFLPGGTLLFTERQGHISFLRHNGQVWLIHTIPDVKAAGEGGLMGLAVDPNFEQNRYIYACFNSMARDIRVARWKLTEEMLVTDRKDIITGIPANNGATPGRHSGCRLRFGPDNNLWVGTGDTAQGDTSVQPRGLGGKILRVTREGQAVAGNMGGEFDPRIYSYGHRNVQGLAFFTKAKNGVPGVSMEHGPDRDDEVNTLRPGNFGWAPSAVGYNESVPMTDLNRFPNAIASIWSSGAPTQAPSGGTIINGYNWKGWNGSLAVAMLKGKHLRILRLDDHNKVIKEEKALDNAYGRLRAVTQGPNGDLYVSTDNGQNDKIILLMSGS
ncbi:MAG TPA: PQQ-dependent sugar dehydrogenase [Candidatus Saccharimonadales bacterium]